MNTKLSHQKSGRDTPGFNGKAGKPAISMIDRKRIFIFVAITHGVSIALYLVVFLNGRMSGSYPLLGVVRGVLMLVPLIAHIAARLITREGWSNTFFRPDMRSGRWRYYLLAWFLPPVAIFVGGTIYYLLFPEHFDPFMTAYREAGIAKVGNTMEPLAFFITQVGIGIFAVPLSDALIGSFGEEAGWRAYLMPKLMSLGPRKAVLLVGVIWGVWHWPSILMGSDYGFGYWGAPVVGPLLFVVGVCLESAFYAWVTLRSGSVWPAALCHGAFNSANSLVWIFFQGELNPLLGPGAQGIIGMLGIAFLALVIFLNPRALAQFDSAPVDKSLSENMEANEKTADQASFGTTI